MKAILDSEVALRRAGCNERVIDHCRAVRRLALEFSRAPADRDLVAAGAMLHDIGRGATHSIAHGQRGAEICRDFGFPAEICRIVERHIGAGMTADECALQNLVPRDCVPVSLEEKIVAHADNLVRGRQEISIEARLLRSPHLSRRIKTRMYRLAREVELFR